MLLRLVPIAVVNGRCWLSVAQDRNTAVNVLLAAANDRAVGGIQKIAFRDDFHQVPPGTGNDRVLVAPANHVLHLLHAGREAALHADFAALFFNEAQFGNIPAFFADGEVERVHVLRFERAPFVGQRVGKAECVKGCRAEDFDNAASRLDKVRRVQDLGAQRQFEAQHGVGDSVCVDFVIAVLNVGLDGRDAIGIDDRQRGERLVQALE